MEMAVRQALRERPEISQQRITIERREFDARFFRNQRLPQVDLTGSYGPSATGGINENSNQDYFDVFSDLLKRDNEAWSIRVDFRYALQNRAAKAQSAIADLALEESAVQLSNVEQDILLDVRRAGRAVLTAEKQIEAAKSSSRLARKNLEAEQKRYENGLATSFTLLDIQEALSTQLRQEVNAIIDYRTALVAFANARGVLLDEMGVELASGE
jgi:outer membrane protein TolC